MIIEQNNTLRWTTFPNLSGSVAIETVSSWPAIIAILKHPKTYSKKKACPLLSLTTYGEKRTEANSLRHTKNALQCFGIELDYDGEVIAMSDACDTFRMFGIRAAFYTSPSHTKKPPRWRVVLPLSSPHAPSARHGLVAMGTDSWKAL